MDCFLRVSFGICSVCTILDLLIMILGAHHPLIIFWGFCSVCTILDLLMILDAHPLWRFGVFLRCAVHLSCIVDVF